MREVVVVNNVSLDGVMQAPGLPDEDQTGGFPYGGWLAPLFDEETGAFLTETMSKPFDLLLARGTYDILAAYWPTATEDAGAKPLNDATKYVASRGTPALPWSPSVLLTGDVPARVAELKQSDGPELQIHGSPGLVNALWRAGLIDRFRLVITPIALGTGKRLFTEAGTLRLIDSRTSSRGNTLATFEPAGEIVTGSMA
ncbi:dihydrofolate reductase family protein [Paractinoplanes lichenicola]|uniref:Dihydrofolate reductase family protein n=1 Tax=Paractinoplanes lichenicola TaxID=2802976 RepID=A0ABS1VWX3_9ACTN|nr:dihydrofolate reductase family protein [Actinoplanes lichenicola]MBL7258986.1 dihydrofolate reductase family protein [Actinoplanes lichenicola]